MATRIAVIGAGPGGYAAAVRAAQMGAQVCLIEKAAVGGTCLNQGCIPSKILKTSAELLDRFRHAGEFGIRLEGAPSIDVAALMCRKQRIIQTQGQGIEKLLRHHGVMHIAGTASVAGPGRVIVIDGQGARQAIDWDRLILAVGATPMPLPGVPFDGRWVISSSDALNLEAIPESMLIVGGGVIGCEFACLLAAMGTQVTVVEAQERLLPLPSIDADCSKVLLREMKKRKIRVLLEHGVGQVSVCGGTIAAAAAPLKGEGPPLTLNAAQLLVCIGRRPATTDLGLARIGLECDPRGWISVDTALRTRIPDVYAIGDVLGPEKVMLAHVAAVEGRVAAENAMGADSRMRYNAVPSAIFSIPEVAAVGLGEAQARREGHDTRAATVLFRVIGKAQVLGEPAGEAKIVFEGHGGRILGVHLIGPHATDLIAEATLAVTTGRTIYELADTLHAHPTLGEIMGEVALKSVGKALHG